MDDERAAGFEPAAQITIQSLDTLKVFSDPLRQQIIEALLDSAKTVKQVASMLHLPPTKLYYHINLLEAHHLIRVTETRVVSGIIEKQYRAAAKSFYIQRSLLSPGQTDESGDGVDTALNAFFTPVRGEIQRSVQAGVIDMSDDAPLARRLRMWRAMSRMSDADAEVFYKRLEALVEEFDTLDTHDEEQCVYNLLVVIYPGNEGAADTTE